MTADDRDDANRPDPDAILARMKDTSRGKLTLFLGAIAGVGKTFAMLQAAQERLGEGIDIVVGVVETHGRKETAALLVNLPLIEKKNFDYRESTFEEMNLDAILERKPAIVLVDELAHMNIPGSRHPRRYLDVEELLEAGIDVYTTLNIQHVESLNGAVAQITGIEVRETVPDQFLERADYIRLIDIPPEELVRRLKEGKVYIPQSIERALRNFFRTGNINALRELTLRYAAERVDQEVSDYRREHHISQPWHAGELVLACTSTNPFGATVLRTAKRLASGLHADLLVANVESGRQRSDADEQYLAKNMRLAEEMGAEVLTLSGRNIPREILDLTFKRNVTEIVVGKPLKRGFRERFKRSIVDEIISGSRGISVHVVPGDPAAARERHRRRINFRAPVIRYLEALALVALVTVLAKVLGAAFHFKPAETVLDLTNIAMLYLLPVVYAAVRGGIGPAVVSSLAGVVAFDIFFVPPVGAISVADLRYLISFAVMLLVGLTIGTIASRLRYRVEDSRLREAGTQALYSMAKELAAVTDMEMISEIVVNHTSRHVDGDTVLYLPEADGTMRVSARSSANAESIENHNERAVASWTFTHSRVAGRGTDTLPGAQCVYVPLSTDGRSIGVLAVCLKGKKAILGPRQQAILEALAGLAALSLSRSELVRFGEHVRYLEESERLRTALLNSVSHDLRTPLATITGAVTSLLASESHFTSEEQKALLGNIESAASRMDRTTGNLLSMARLESGFATLNRDWYDIEDIVGVVLGQYDQELKERAVILEVPEELPLLRADYGLIEQVLSNLIDNAIKYSPEGSEIRVVVTTVDDYIRVSVVDNGRGLPEEDIDKVFDKFYRLQRDSGVGGTGLGLSISKGIIEAHGGRVWAENRLEGGAVVGFALPLENSSVEEEIEGGDGSG